ncbi:MAG TPA: response regulator [Ktedonobacterales bacterium]|nr:response regulator [Ktedonobacterales bacterium]
MSNSWPPPRLTGVPARNPRDGLAVLFVDPDIVSAHRLAMALGGLLSNFAVAATAQAAVEAIRARIPDVIVTELDLLDARGVELIAWLHSMPATRHVLLLVLTAQASVMHKVAAFQAGADDYLVKPVEAGTLATHLRLLMRFRQVLS